MFIFSASYKKPLKLLVYCLYWRILSGKSEFLDGLMLVANYDDIESNTNNQICYMGTYKALYLSPMIPSYNIEETARLFKEILGFSPVMETETYAIFQKDNLTIHILRAGQDIGQMEFYLEVDNVDILWATIKDKIQGLNVREPFNQVYGMREIHIGIPQTNTLLFIGQELQ